MANLEPLKNLNTLMEQVVNLAEKDPSLVKMLELAAQVAKYWRPSTSRPTWSAPKETEEEQPADGAGTVASLDKIQSLNSTVKSLGEILELVNQLAKQMVKFGPFLSALMKYQSPSTAPRKKRHEKSYISGFGNPDEKMITNALMGLLIPILLINLTRKSAI